MEPSLAEFLKQNFASRLKAKNPINPKVFKYIPYFSEVFDEEVWPLLAQLSGSSGIAHIEHKVLKPGAKIIGKGEFDMMVFWLLKGKVEVVGMINNRPTVFKRYDKLGHCFGELAIIDEGARTADVVASRDEGATILEVDWSITDICRELTAKFTHLLLKTINRKLIDSYDSTKNAYAALQILQEESLSQSKEIQKLRSILLKNGLTWSQESGS